MLNNLTALLDSGAVAAVGDYESIQTVTVGAGGSSAITFSSIPSTYTHLQIRGIGKNTNTSGAGTNLNMIFNSDSGANYSYHSIYGDGSSATWANGTSTTSMWIGHTTTSATSSPNATSIFAGNVTDIWDYANTNKYKTTRNLGGYDNNGNGLITLGSGLWQNTNAITSIKLIDRSGNNLIQYSQFALYGIKGA